MMLEEHALRLRRMAHDFVDALAPLGILLIGRHESRADSFLARLPSLAAILSSVNTASGDRNPHSLLIRRIGKNRVQTKAAATRHPRRAMRTIEEAAIQRPTLATVRRLARC